MAGNEETTNSTENEEIKEPAETIESPTIPVEPIKQPEPSISPENSPKSNTEPLNTIPEQRNKPHSQGQRNGKFPNRGRRYSIAQRIAIKALQDSHLTPNQASVLADANPNTIRRIWESRELDDLVPNAVTKIKSGLGGLFYKRALGAALAITEAKMEQSSALQLATVAGIMTEKGRLMEGLSTQSLSFAGIAQSIESDRSKLMERLEALE